jgi:hypothetical protein
MTEFELFLKGLNAVLRRFFYSVVDVGAAAEEIKPAAVPGKRAATRVQRALVPEAPAPRVRKSRPRATPGYRDWVSQRVIEGLSHHPNGISLRALAKELELEWQTIVRPVTRLAKEGAIAKHEGQKLYAPQGSTFEKPAPGRRGKGRRGGGAAKRTSKAAPATGKGAPGPKRGRPRKRSAPAEQKPAAEAVESPKATS